MKVTRRTVLNHMKSAGVKLAAIGMVACLSFASGPANATAVTTGDLSTASCSPSYFESLKSRAWLEGQRRTRQAQNYIRKPDSVLDYSCFPILNNISALETEQIFSEQHAGHCFPDSLDCSLDRLVITALTSYLGQNYNHTFIGGRSNLSRAAYDPDNVTMCTVMRDVWQLAKCQNFMPDADIDGFLNFEEYTSTDPRMLPEPCAAPYPENDPAEWTGHIETAYTPTTPTGWYQELIATHDDVDTAFTQWLDLGNSPPGCGNFIASGVMTFSETSIFYTTPQRDGVCPNPACAPNNVSVCVLMTF